MSEISPVPNNIEEIDLALWGIEMEKGQPHSHFEVVSAEKAEVFKKAANGFASIAIRELSLDTEQARKLAPSEDAVRAWEQGNYTEKGYVGMEVSTVPGLDGKHSENGTQEFYDKIKEIEDSEKAAEA